MYTTENIKEEIIRVRILPSIQSIRVSDLFIYIVGNILLIYCNFCKLSIESLKFRNVFAKYSVNKTLAVITAFT